MKKFHYRKRWLSHSVKIATEMMESGAISVITLTGARQVGKTTFVKHEKPFSSWGYINLDDLDTLAIIKNNPELVLRKEKHLVIDEIQRAPELLLKIKLLADNENFKFLLTGSANILVMKNVSETLAGRSVIFSLLPFALREWEEKDPGVIFDFLYNEIEPKERKSHKLDIKSRIINGSMPATMLLKRGFRIWWDGYIKTYIERDLRDISSISNLADFHRMLEILAHMSGNLLVETDIARNIGISVPTTHRWINILETSFIIFKLRPYLKGKISRIRKTPKIYFIDPALSFHLMKTEKPTQKEWGRLFENFVFLQLLAMKNAFGGELYFWRTSGSTEREVDFVLEYKRRVIGIEAKFKEEVTMKDASNLVFFCENSNCEAGFIVYTGDKIIKLLSNIWAIPVWEI